MPRGKWGCRRATLPARTAKDCTMPWEPPCLPARSLWAGSAGRGMDRQGRQVSDPGLSPSPAFHQNTPAKHSTVKAQPSSCLWGAQPSLRVPGQKKQLGNVSFSAGLQLCTTSHNSRLGPPGAGRHLLPDNVLLIRQRVPQPPMAAPRRGPTMLPWTRAMMAANGPKILQQRGGLRQQSPPPCHPGGHLSGSVQPWGTPSMESAALGDTQHGWRSPGGHPARTAQPRGMRGEPQS